MASEGTTTQLAAHTEAAGTGEVELASDCSQDTSAGIDVMNTVVDGRREVVDDTLHRQGETACSAVLVGKEGHVGVAREAAWAVAHVALQADDGSSYPGTLQPRVASMGAM